MSEQGNLISLQQLVARLRAQRGHLANATHALLAAPEGSDPLPQALSELCAAAGTGRAILFDNFSHPKDGLCLRQTTEALALNVTTTETDPRRQNWPFRQGLERWRQLLVQGRAVSGRIANLTAGEREFFADHNTLAVLLLPVMVDGQWQGVLSFEDTLIERTWSEEDIELLRIGSSLIGDYLTDRRRLETLQQVQAELEARVQERTAALQASETRSRGLLQAIPDMLFRLNSEGKYLDYKPAEVLSGSAPLRENPTGRTIHEVMPPLVASELQQAIQRTLETGRPQTVEYQLAATIPGSELRDYEARLARMQADEVLAVVRDITTRKRTEAALRSVNDTLVRQTTDLERRGMQLQGAVEVTRDITALENPRQIMQQAVNLVRTRFGLHHTAIFEVDDAQHAATLVAATGELGHKLISRRFHILLPDSSPLGQVVATSQVQNISQLGRNSVYAIEADLANVQSELLMPMRVGQRLIGVLVLQSVSAESFQSDDIPVYQLVADQLAFAIENARLFEQNRQALLELEERYGEQVQQNWQTRLQNRSLGFGYSPEGLQPITESTKLQASGEGLAVHNESYARQLRAKIKLRGQTIGTIFLQRDDNQPSWSTEEFALVQDVATQIALALENARLVEETRDALAETQRLADRDRRVADVTDKIHKELDLQSILEVATAELRRATGRKRVVVRLSPPKPEGDVDQ